MFGSILSAYPVMPSMSVVGAPRHAFQSGTAQCYALRRNCTGRNGRHPSLTLSPRWQAPCILHVHQFTELSHPSACPMAGVIITH